MTQSAITQAHESDDNHSGDHSIGDYSIDNRSVLINSVIREGVRQSRQSANQAHWSFLVATVMTAASALIGLGGAGLLLSGKASEGTVTTAVGLASGVYSYQLSKEAGDRQKQANERLDQLLQQLQEER
ncbi:MAG: hypothetical protein Kow00121_06800 [Elainellaceae cyanobacterium]